MTKKKRKIKTVQAVSSEFINIKKQLAYLKENKRKINEDKDLYYFHELDLMDMKEYYKNVPSFDSQKGEKFYLYHNLVSKTHKNRIPYFISKDLYLYTWVDLHPDGQMKSIYSGERKSPEQLIMEDHESIRRRYEEYQHYLQKVKLNESGTIHLLKSIAWNIKLNTEHIVPQSWFGGLEPMKGDLHHLFICEPECNIARSNFAYADFSFYEPESPYEPIQNCCGIATGNRFEPEYGKGAISRAMLYFLLRYPKEIRKSFLMDIDLSLLIKWNEQFEVTIYEKHRNQAIYRIQGNRNPFIDYPHLATEMTFPSIS